MRALCSKVPLLTADVAWPLTFVDSLLVSFWLPSAAAINRWLRALFALLLRGGALRQTFVVPLLVVIAFLSSFALSFSTFLTFSLAFTTFFASVHSSTNFVFR